jgi:flagellar biosynthesis protein FlhF
MLNQVKVIAEDSAAAMEKITRELGADARIISTRKLGSGVEIIACPPMDFAAHLEKQSASSTVKRTSRRMEEFAALLDDARQANQPRIRQQEPTKAPIQRGADDNRLTALEGSIAEIKAMLGSELMANGLMAAGASPALISIFLAQANAIEGPRSDRNFAAFLASRLVHKDPPNLCGGQRIVVALGPSGSGKTTMLAQLAAKIRLGNSEARVAFVNADARRLAASEQLQAYGRIMDVPVVDIEKVRELSGFVRNADSQLTMLVDMPSGGTDCETLMQELNSQSDELAPITRIGVIASTLSADSITQMFETYPDIDAIALTKLNEARVTLTAISQLSMRRAPVAYLSTDSHLMRGLTEADASTIERLIRGSLPGVRRESAA